MLCVDVLHSNGQYPIYIGNNLLTNSKLFPVKSGDKVMIVTNETVAQYYLDTLQQTLNELGCETNVCLIGDGEAYKNLETLNHIYTTLLEHNYGRDCILVALGGGVVGDICGLAAATYQRGVRFIQVPTTLLAQVDSSVGGKTAVNHPLGKNMIGAFYQPQAVIIDLNTLNTLPPREIAAGLAEVIKYGVALDNLFFTWLCQNIIQLKHLDLEALAYAVARCCQLKAQIVMLDEKEAGQRALLNFGHTFGHAIETEMGYGNWLHGEAVAVGMCIATKLSAKLNQEKNNETVLLDSDVTALYDLLKQAGLPTCIPQNMPLEQFFVHMQRDKKVMHGKMRLILLRSLGKSYVDSDIPKIDIEQVLKTCYH